MKVIGFNMTKIAAQRDPFFKQVSTINTNIEFTEIEKAKVDLNIEIESLRLLYKFTIAYNEGEEKQAQKKAEIFFEGEIIIAVDKEESNEIMKAWKKKEVSPNFKAPLFNIILRKCTPKALALEEEINLPTHIPMPQIEVQKK